MSIEKIGGCMNQQIIGKLVDELKAEPKRIITWEDYLSDGHCFFSAKMSGNNLVIHQEYHSTSLAIREKVEVIFGVDQVTSLWEILQSTLYRGSQKQEGGLHYKHLVAIATSLSQLSFAV